MLNFCGEHNISCMIQNIYVDYVNTATKQLEKGDVKYRFVIDVGKSFKQNETASCMWSIFLLHTSYIRAFRDVIEWSNCETNNLQQIVAYNIIFPSKIKLLLTMQQLGFVFGPKLLKEGYIWQDNGLGNCLTPWYCLKKIGNYWFCCTYWI